jgi:Domain of unknown function (DUF4258)
MPAKPIRISGHACFEMRRRGISRAEVLRMIRSPGQVLPSANGRHIYQGLLGPTCRLLLRVVVKEDAQVYHVVTAYKTSKVAKYWSTPP